MLQISRTKFTPACRNWYTATTEEVGSDNDTEQNTRQPWDINGFSLRSAIRDGDLQIPPSSPRATLGLSWFFIWEVQEVFHFKNWGIHNNQISSARPLQSLSSVIDCVKDTVYYCGLAVPSCFTTRRSHFLKQLHARKENCGYLELVIDCIEGRLLGKGQQERGEKRKLLSWW